jgi:hypothetical protein
MENQINVYNNFLSSDECDYILNFAQEFFEIDYRIRGGQRYKSAKTNRNFNFENEIKEKLNKITPISPFHISWMNMTEYEVSDSLNLHTDLRSDCTFQITLTDGYEGGNFIIENKKYKTNKGDCILFNGHDLEHGVEPIKSGYRASLNIWIKKGEKPML